MADLVTPGSAFPTLMHLLRGRASESADRRAFSFLNDRRTEEVHFTFAELERRARAIAVTLVECGARGERVALFYPQGLDYIAGFFGCVFAGAVAVPAYPPLHRSHIDRIKAIVDDSRAALVLTQRSVVDGGRLAGLGFNDAHEQPPRARPGRPTVLATDDLIDGADDWRAPDVRPDDVVFLQYTSGSTARPRGVKLTHRNLLHNASTIEMFFAITPESRAVSWLPLFHDMGLIGMVITPLFARGYTALMSPLAFLKRPLLWLEEVSRHQADISGGPDFAYELCAQKITPERLEQLDLSRWRVAFNGAEVVRARTLERFAAAFAPAGFRPEALYPCYGLAEASLMVTGGTALTLPTVGSFSADALQSGSAAPAADESGSSRRIVGCGRAHPSQTVAIVHPDTGRRCADRQIGEIWVHGPSVSSGYWEQADSDGIFNARIDGTGEGPFLRTGDLGFQIDGELFVTGRIKELIVIRGRNFFPDDLELTAASSNPHASSRTLVAFSTEVDGAERLIVAQEVDAGIDAAEMDRAMRSVRESIAGTHDVETHAVVLVRSGSLPRTSSGKIQRRACAERYAAGELPVIASSTDEPRTGSASAPSPRRSAGSAVRGRYESWLAAWVARQAHVEETAVDVEQTFAHYNLGSVDAIQLIGDLEDWVGRRFSPTVFYDYPTIKGLAGFLAGESPTAEQAVPQTAEADGGGIAVVGFACRFPGADSPEAFWTLLRNGGDSVSDMPPDRRRLLDRRSAEAPATSLRGGFLDGVDLFDADFFGIAPREATSIDPQQRLLLETAWEALERAGRANAALKSSRTGVFIGISTNDYHHLVLGSTTGIDPYLGTGNAASIAANRLSYVFDLRGPSVAIDTACSSSLVAVHLACRSLLAGECDMALAGGVNLTLSPELTIAFEKAGMLSPRGRCGTFDAGADGYVRGEGCGIVVLERLADTLRTGDSPAGVIAGSAVNQDGRSAGLTAPNGPAQEAVIRAALAAARVAPSQVSYVETHGTGTPLGDPIEVEALKRVRASSRAAGSACALGAVKTNIGHLEAAAGVAGLIKVLLALEHREIPPNVHFTRLNPTISLEQTDFFLPTEPVPWNGGDPRVGGVSSFGFGGTNCHVVVTDPPAAAPPEDMTRDRPVHLFPLSARTPDALRRLAARYDDALDGVPASDLPHVCFTAATGRTHFDHRLAVACESIEELREALREHARGGEVGGADERSAADSPAVAFLFTGQGSQYAGMGRELYEGEPTFRAALERCDAALQPWTGTSLIPVLFEAADGRLDQTGFTQPALFALEYALVELWASWGVRPAAVLGHSIGEYAAAVAAGVLGLEEAARLVARRASLMQALPAGGAMAVVWGSEAAVTAAVAEQPGVWIAAINAPGQVVLSGEARALDATIAAWEATGGRAQRLTVSHAFHSGLMDPMLDAFAAETAAVAYALPSVEWVSALTGGVAGAEVAKAAYWTRQARDAVQFAQGVRTLAARGFALYLEIGPQPVLTALGRETVRTGEWLASLRAGRSAWAQILESLGRAYVAGVDVDWAALNRGRPRRRIALPTYPFERQRYWPVAAAAGTWGTGAEHPAANPTAGADAREARLIWSMSTSSLPYLADHRVAGTPVLPAAALVEMAVAAADTLGPGPWTVGDLTILRPFAVGTDIRKLHVHVSGNGASTIRFVSPPADEGAGSGEILYAQGTMIPERDPSPPAAAALAAARERLVRELSRDALYADLERRGLEYGPAFRLLDQVHVGPGEALAHVALASADRAQASDYRLHPALLDGAFQVIAAAAAGSVHDEDTYVPVAVGGFRSYAIGAVELWAHARVSPADSPRPDTITAEVTMFDAESGAAVAHARDVSLKRVDREMFLAAATASSFRPAGHPLLGTRLQPRAEAPDAESWQRDIGSRGIPDVVTYRTPSGIVLHIGAFAQLARAAAREGFGQDGAEVASLQLHSALVLPPGSRRLLQTTLSRNGPGTHLVRVHSRSGDERDASGWTLHATASVSPAD